MEVKNPVGIRFIGWFQVFGALIVLLTLKVEQEVAFNIRFAVPFIPEIIVRILLITFSLIIAYGYLKRTKWGYYSMLIYSVIFCLISLFGIFQHNNQPFIGNAIYSAIVVVYTIINSKYFNENKYI